MVRNRAFTLIELLVVITIIGILMGLLMPGLASMKENGRRLQCSNNLHNIGIATLAHVAANGTYPTGGWGYGWAGDPDYGYNFRQPGGWIYNLLPFMDNVALHDMGKGMNTAQKRTAFGQRAGIPIPIFNCPTRRRPATYPFNASSTPATNPNINYDPDVAGTNSRTARSDYAANGGSNFIDHTSGPTTAYTEAQAADTSYKKEMNPSTATPSAVSGYAAMRSEANGIVFPLSTITPAHVRDGASMTYLAGEKHLCPDYRSTGTDAGDRLCMYNGDGRDITRWTREPPLMDRLPDAISTSGTIASIPNWLNTASNVTIGFGSSHPAGFNVVFCDGSVRLVNYAIQLKIHRALSTRDGIERVDYNKRTVNNNDPYNDGLERPVKPDDIP
jgi:prepilin-type N-terminal cleavage/methylation domain-containing protein/prepilin-type processing-associated H-X9-DG protein